MSMVHARSSRFSSLFLLLLGPFLIQGADPASAVETVVLRSGNAPAGNPDPSITMLAAAGGAPLSGSLFTSADFDAACTGPNAFVGTPHSAWIPQISCDPQAQWIGYDANCSPATMLFCQPFDVQTCCISRATLTFCWAADDGIGDGVFGGPNAAGVYINGSAVTPTISGGSYASETTVIADVTDLVGCGPNTLEVYDRDAGFAVTGVLYSATIEVEDCLTSTEPSSWGSIKSLYR